VHTPVARAELERVAAEVAVVAVMAATVEAKAPGAGVAEAVVSAGEQRARSFVCCSTRMANSKGLQSVVYRSWLNLLLENSTGHLWMAKKSCL
jgi:hypothetical protein